MPSDYSAIQLPICEVIPSLLQQLSQKSTCIVQAAPGAGKSTVVPLCLLEETWLEDKKIIVLEPRRIAARAIAERMANLLGEQVGETVGYRIRFETNVSERTRIEVVTEGILTRMLQTNTILEDIACVIFDEFHERNLHSELGLALCRNLQTTLRPELRLVIMSATLNAVELQEKLQAPCIESEGRQFPIDISYSADCDSFSIAQHTAHATQKIIQKHEGDILVFLPGEGEIRTCEELLKNLRDTCSIHSLYGQLPFAQQQTVLRKNTSGKRKIVLATNIAETSITIEGIRIVIDSGLERVVKFNSVSGLMQLEVRRISVDAADQRAGRAGRTAAGQCLRLWSLGTQHQLQAHRTPEIEQADLCSLVLELSQWGTLDYTQLQWITPPPKTQYYQALRTLETLGAIENNTITVHGKELQNIATHPRLAHMMLKARAKKIVHAACDIAALLSERDPLAQETQETNIALRMNALRRFRTAQKGSKTFARIAKIAEQYRSFFKEPENNESVDEYDIGLLLAYAYPERIASAKAGNNAQFLLANGSIASMPHTDELANHSWLAVAAVSERESGGKIFLAAPLDPLDLKEMLTKKDIITWNRKKGGIVAQTELRIGSILLQAIPLQNISTEKIIDTIIVAVEKEGQFILNWNDRSTQLQNRIQSLAVWNPHQQWTDMSTENLCMTANIWLRPYLNNVKTTDDLQKLPLYDILFFSLSPEQQNLVEILAPEKIEVPSGSKITLNYFANGAAPELSVKLQECFGMLNTPTVNNGSVTVVMHLLSPGFNLVQVTSDLHSFWTKTYIDIRKDLRIRYKKHLWPENPLEAKAVKGVRF
ncbi:MAG: ATP-dependent helicase HrpB [Bacteroidales bacterium]|jgi:ATP-dependent helicase HrpB|nr:ATP-dependent helicase HrpB [Bacteroidales bacterium]